VPAWTTWAGGALIAAAGVRVVMDGDERALAVSGSA